MRRIMFFVGLVISLSSLYRNKYKLLNIFLSKKWLRRLSVAMIMRIPAVREKMLFQALR
ncbi:sodium:proton antiporter [Evansella clarkii]|uniref:sodium:proton antiporter n=1 Tax=Evansella clarkii TaxID=79879 RepID=UPI000B444E89|nr:sodium:proton antiporter [Evansella clarkii]